APSTRAISRATEGFSASTAIVPDSGAAIAHFQCSRPATSSLIQILSRYQRRHRAEIRHDLVLCHRTQQHIRFGGRDLVLGGQPVQHVRVGRAQAEIHTTAEFGLASDGYQILVVHQPGNTEALVLVHLHRKLYVEGSLDSRSEAFAVTL